MLMTLAFSQMLFQFVNVSSDSNNHGRGSSNCDMKFSGYSQLKGLVFLQEFWFSENVALGWKEVFIMEIILNWNS